MHDSPTRSDDSESLRRVDEHEVIVISDSTESPDRISKKTRKLTPENSQDSESYIPHSTRFGLGHSSRACQVSTTCKILSRTKAVQRDSSAVRKNGNEAHLVHRHIHKHTHKHRHKHKHKHKHRHEHKHGHKKTNNTTELEAYAEHASSATKTRPAGSEIVRKVHSPKLEDMQKEVDELNVLIQQHEETLSRLNRRTES